MAPLLFARRLAARLANSKTSVPAPYDVELRQFVEQAGDFTAYLEANPDVAAAGFDALTHWLEHGIEEGRELPGIEVRHRAMDANDAQSGWRRFTWRDKPIALRKRIILPSKIMRQIMAQSQHDYSILAPGAGAIPRLRQFQAPNLFERDGVDVSWLFASVPERPANIVIVPFLLLGGAEKYAADLVAALATVHGGPTLVLVTAQTAEEAQGWQKLSILPPLKQATVVFWRDAFGSFGDTNPATLARFLLALRPERIIVINSELGLEALARFGRGLSQFAQLACAYFSISKNAIGAPYGARFPRRTLPFALALTDNEPMAETLIRLHGEIKGPGIAVLPSRLPPVHEATFRARLAARRARSITLAARRRWVWLSRVEPHKGTAILAELAKARPDDQFDIYGPHQADPHCLGLAIRNITIKGTLPDVSDADFSAYDGFLFTSLFEGMPNIVLEMSQHAIPMVLAEVGGLRGTLDDTAAIFVRHGNSTEESMRAFSEALDRLAAMSSEQVADMATAAHHQVRARHSPEAHARRVAMLFDLT